MLQRVMEYLNNYFVQKTTAGFPVGQIGTFTVTDGALSLDFAAEGQRILIRGSAMHDGVYTWHTNRLANDDDTGAAGISDGDFHAEVCALAVPPALLALVSEMREWESSNAEAVNSPYQSESVIGVYSYTKAAGAEDAGGDVTLAHFAGRMKRWKKVSL